MLTIPTTTNPLTLPARFRRGATALWRETDGGWYGPRGACGCCESCNIFSDDFNRADDTDLGSNWSEVSGSWSIASNTLATSSANAVCLRSSAASVSALSLTCKVKFSANNDTARIVLAYVDSNNYIFAEAKSGTSGGLWLYERVGGTDNLIETTSASIGLDTWHGFKLCLFEDGGAVAQINVNFLASAYVGGDLASTAGQFGLATGGTVTGTVSFDDVDVQKVSDNCDPCNTDCPSCTDDAPPSIIVEITESDPEFWGFDGTYELFRTVSQQVGINEPCLWGGLCNYAQDQLGGDYCFLWVKTVNNLGSMRIRAGIEVGEFPVHSAGDNLNLWLHNTGESYPTNCEDLFDDVFIPDPGTDPGNLAINPA